MNDPATTIAIITIGIVLFIVPAISIFCKSIKTVIKAIVVGAIILTVSSALLGFSESINSLLNIFIISMILLGLAGLISFLGKKMVQKLEIGRL